MKYTQELLESMVIHDYLGGNTRAQIALDHKISTGNVSNITSEWAKRIGKHDAKEIREFVVLVKKSGLSIEQCAQGFRTAMLMKNLGINCDSDDGGKDVNEEFTTFVKEIYINCKNFGINPETLSKWVKDLFDCYSICVKTSESFSFDAFCEEDEDTDLNAEENKETKENKQQQQFPVYFKKLTTGSQNIDKIADSNCISDPNPSDKEPSPYLYGFNQGLSNNEVEIPFVSQVSDFIAQKKKECAEIKDYERKLEDETKRLRNQENQIKDNLNKIIQKEKKVSHYLDCFYKLKKELWDNYNIRIEEI